MKKNDLILILVIVLLAAGCYVGVKLYGKYSTSNDAMAVVVIDGKETESYPLNKDIEVDIEGADGGHNRLIIKDGFADIVEADCPDKICVNQKEIAANGESLVCLPHKVVVKIVNGEESTLDTIAN